MKNFSLAPSFVLILVLFSSFAIGQDVELPDDLAAPAERDKQDSPHRNLAAFVVNDSGDATDVTPGNAICETGTGNGICTLRAAVVEANALAGTDTIIFDPAVTTILLPAGQISITSAMNIVGNGAGVLTIQNTAGIATTSRVFNITNFVVNLSGMTLTGGNVTGNGGAIQNIGTLTINRCVVTANKASAVGGGIRSTNTLTMNDTLISNNESTASTSGGISFAGANLLINNSTIRGNTSSGNGGGLNSSATVSATITNSTISGNIAGASSGGMFLNRGTIRNSTISTNTANGALATDGGGGVRIQAGTATVSIIASTITNNTAPNAALGARSGIWHETGTLTFSNTIIARNVTQDIQRDGTGVITSNGFNLIGENTSVATEFPAGMPSGTDYVGTEIMPLDSLLGPLGPNGGATETHPVTAASPALDKGFSFGLSIDQRGFTRTIDLADPNTPGGDGTDIGAFEFMSAGAQVFVSGRVLNSSGVGIGKARITLTNTSGISRVALTNPFGNYSFQGVESGQTYTFTVAAKQHVFVEPTRVITVLDNISDFDFTSQ